MQPLTPAMITNIAAFKLAFTDFVRYAVIDDHLIVIHEYGTHLNDQRVSVMVIAGDTYPLRGKLRAAGFDYPEKYDHPLAVETEYYDWSRIFRDGIRYASAKGREYDQALMFWAKAVPREAGQVPPAWESFFTGMAVQEVKPHRIASDLMRIGLEMEDLVRYARRSRTIIQYTVECFKEILTSAIDAGALPAHYPKGQRRIELSFGNHDIQSLAETISPAWKVDDLWIVPELIENINDTPDGTFDQDKVNDAQYDPPIYVRRRGAAAGGGDMLAFVTRQGYISVANGQARVARVETLGGKRVMVLAQNWQELEADAVQEVTAQGGASSLSANYAASKSLLGKAVWSTPNEAGAEQR